MPACTVHGHMNCRECFPRPSLAFASRCTSKNSINGRQCQLKKGHAGLHERDGGAHKWHDPDPLYIPTVIFLDAKG